ncbi:MAG: hypothetical protein K6T31_03505 [Alicyclobacillus sp.]|nr:hypothetical protein [Alicyclobacillus sp.]
MEHDPRTTREYANSVSQPVVSTMNPATLRHPPTNRGCAASPGVTMVELLAALVLGSLVLATVLTCTFWVMRDVPALAARNQVNAELQTVAQRLQRECQNAVAVQSLPSDGVELVRPDGTLVYIHFIPYSTWQGQPVLATAVDTEPPGSSSFTRTWVLSPGVNLAGSSVKAHGSRVTFILQGVSVGTATPTESGRLVTTFAVGGGF